jgi:hypothetical protein
MRYSEFTEARKNPEKNPKDSFNSELFDLLRKTFKSTGTMQNLFVSFTKVDKLGINPVSRYNTPLGIYSYPAAYVANEVGPKKSMTELPFAGDSPYATIFKSKGNIIDLNKISDTEVNDYYKKIAEYWSKVSGKPWKTSVDEVEDIINAANNRAKVSSSGGGRLWYVTMEVSRMMAEGKKSSEGIAKPSAVSWNKLFRVIGISGCVDNGEGIIHTSEPQQAVFFDIGAVDPVKRVYNRTNYSTNKLKHSVTMGADVKKYMTDKYHEFRNMSAEDQAAFVLNDPANLKFVSNSSDDLIWPVLFKHPNSIVYLKNPTEAMKEFSIKADPSNIQYIKKPSTALQKLAISISGAAIKYIINAKFDPATNKKKISIYPSEELQKLAVQNSGMVLALLISYEIKPSEAVQQAAVTSFNYSIRQLMSRGITPSETVQKIAVQSNPSLIGDIIEAGIAPSDDVIAVSGVSLESIAKSMYRVGLPLSPKLKQAAGVQ